jgi:hypothetical protein
MIGDIPPLTTAAGLAWSARTILHAIENIDQSHVSLLFGKPPPHGGDLLLASFSFCCRVVHCLSASGRSPFFMKNLMHRNGPRSLNQYSAQVFEGRY